MGFIAVKSLMLDEIKKNNNVLAQESDMVWLYDKDGQWVFRVRRKVGNELQVSRIPNES